VAEDGEKDDPRRRRLLDAALGVFARFGFRKTSMDEVARAAGLSRQGLYLHFSTKEELFRATVEHALATSLAEATASLDDASLGLEGRLVGGFDQWGGRYVGMFSGTGADLVEATDALVGPLVVEREEQFVEAVARTIRASGLMAAYKPAGLSARQLADTLNMTARGLKYQVTTRAAFVDGITIAVRAMCAPLRGGR
jgi:TetR/AcrR family transcriptional regulator, regulator of autoinduction and epiphytic fitness